MRVYNQNSLIMNTINNVVIIDVCRCVGVCVLCMYSNTNGSNYVC